MAKDSITRSIRIVILAFALSLVIFSGLGIITWDVYRNIWADRSILTDIPCAPPCWQGITPGMTTREQALEILYKNSYIKKGSVNPKGTTAWGGTLFDYRVPEKRMQPGLSWQNGIVDRINLGLTFDLSVKEIIEKYGIPEAVRVMEGGIPEHWYWIVDLYYPSKGINFVSFTPEYDNQFEPSTEIGMIFLFAPTSLEGMIQNEEADGITKIRDMIKPWKGYGDLRELYDIN